MKHKIYHIICNIIQKFLPINRAWNNMHSFIPIQQKGGYHAIAFPLHKIGTDDCTTPDYWTSIMPINNLVILACFINKDHLWGHEVCIDFSPPLLPQVFIVLCSCPKKKFERYSHVMNVQMKCSPGYVNLECECDPVWISLRYISGASSSSVYKSCVISLLKMWGRHCIALDGDTTDP